MKRRGKILELRGCQRFVQFAGSADCEGCGLRASCRDIFYNLSTGLIHNIDYDFALINLYIKHKTVHTSVLCSKSTCVAMER